MQQNLAHIRLGETRRASNGQLMTITRYRSTKDLDVQFEDGTLVEHRQYFEFTNGTIRNPKWMRQKHIGETILAANGMRMTIISWRNSQDIDVQFEDGETVRHVRHNCFVKGYIAHPKYNSCNMRARNKHIGETNHAKNGLVMTLIEYRSSSDIDVQFEDGVIVQHKDYSSFRHGGIKHPNIDLSKACQHTKSNRIGESTLAKNGLNATICEYTNCFKMRVKFETGYISDLIQYSQFCDTKIKHPFPYQVGIVNMNKPAYIYNGVGNFYCRCTKCGLEDIMTVQEMRDHICQK